MAPELVDGDDGEAAPPAVESRPPLTPRQIDVLARVVEGKRNKAIGVELGLSEATVKAHITAVFKALGVSNRIQAARAAERLRLKPAARKANEA